MAVKKPYIEDYQGYLIADLSEGMLKYDKEGKVVVFLVDRSDTRAYFAFFDSLCDTCDVPESDDFFKNRCIAQIRSSINTDKVRNYMAYTFQVSRCARLCS